jgi:hypothetical protein
MASDSGKLTISNQPGMGKPPFCPKPSLVSICFSTLQQSQSDERG